MKRLRFTVLKNVVSNVVRGGATAAVALALPHFLVKSLDPDRFAGWSLILQIAAYCSFLDFGLQTAVARFVAQAIERQDYDRVRKLIDTAVTLLSLAGMLALLIIGVVNVNAGSLFHGIPANLLHEFKVAVLIMAFGAAALLPFSAYTGTLIGKHENEYTALAIGGSRCVGALGAILVAHYTRSLPLMACSISAANIGGGLLQMFIVSRRIEGFHLPHFKMDRSVLREFIPYCSGLSFWSLGMLIVSGLDVTIVGHYAFEAAGYYAICVTAINMFSMGNSAVMSAFLAPFSAMHVQGDFNKTRDIVVRSTRVNTAINVAALAAVIVYGRPLLHFWVGSAYADRAYPILLVLMITQTIRLMGSSFSIALIASGHQSANLIPAIVEASTNLVGSIYGVLYLGPIGVAYGSLLGAIAGIPALIVYAVKERPDLRVTREDLAWKGMLVGVASGIPALIASLCLLRLRPGLAVACAVWIAALGLGLLLFRTANRSAYFAVRT